MRHSNHPPQTLGLCLVVCCKPINNSCLLYMLSTPYIPSYGHSSLGHYHSMWCKVFYHGSGSGMTNWSTVIYYRVQTLR